MSQMYETKSLKPNFLSSFSLMFIGANSYFEVLGEKATHIKLTEVN